MEKIRLDALLPISGKRRRKRLGRGPASGRGATSGRGHKGQKARSGYELSRGFEGGQMPLMRRIPKRGFNRYPQDYQIVNLAQLSVFKEDSLVNKNTLREEGLIKKTNLPVKILATGNLSCRLVIDIDVDRLSKKAIEKIESAGGIVKRE